MMDELIRLLQGKFHFDLLLRPSTPLISSGLVDSLDFAALLQTLKTHYGVVIDPADVGADNFDRVDQIYEFLERKRT